MDDARVARSTVLIVDDEEGVRESVRAVLEDIRSGAFARRFQEEAARGYPMLEIARSMIHGPSPISEAEERLRGMTGPPRPSGDEIADRMPPA